MNFATNFAQFHPGVSSEDKMIQVGATLLSIMYALWSILIWRRISRRHEFALRTACISWFRMVGRGIRDGFKDKPRGHTTHSSEQRAKRAKPDFIAILPLGDLVYRWERSQLLAPFSLPDWIENKNAGMDIRWSLARLKTGSLASKLRFRSLNAKLAKLFHRSCPYRGGELSLLNSRTWIELNFHHASAHGI